MIINNIFDFTNDLDKKNKAVFIKKNKNIPKWEAAIKKIKTFNKGELKLTDYYIDINADIKNSSILEKNLKKFRPWRKGPFKIADLKIESEWQGYLKWQRLISNIKPLKNKLVLDVGCSNGCFCFLMALYGAKKVIGIEPFLLFNYQFIAIKSLIKKKPNINLYALRLEELTDAPIFDTVFSMGLLYHQKSPIEHLIKLKKMLIKGGELILETLIIDCEESYTLTPKDRYAKMTNVWFIPSVSAVKIWLKKVGFKKIKLIDTTKVADDEQRKTEWLSENPESLADFLNKDDINLTIENYPAPVRAIFVCEK